MLVKDWMSKVVITVKPDDKMPDALAVMKGNNIRMLPVMNEGRLVGIVTDGDLKKASASDATTLEVKEYKSLLYTTEIKDSITSDPITIPFNYMMEEAAEILLESGATEVSAYCTHGVFSGDAVSILEASPLKRVVVTNTITNQCALQSDKIDYVSVGGHLAKTIRQVFEDRSVSLLFPHY